MSAVNTAALPKRRQVPVRKACGHKSRSAAPLARCPHCCKRLAAPLGAAIVSAGPL
jgi:hypothetical protein